MRNALFEKRGETITLALLRTDVKLLALVHVNQKLGWLGVLQFGIAPLGLMEQARKRECAVNEPAGPRRFVNLAMLCRHLLDGRLARRALRTFAARKGAGGPSRAEGCWGRGCASAIEATTTIMPRPLCGWSYRSKLTGDC